MADAVLDASAFMAVINGEPGADKVAVLLQSATISTVNLSEVVAKLIENGGPEAEVRLIVGSFASLRIEAFDNSLALRAGEMRRATRANGLSFGDRACLALAEREGIPAVTADRHWDGVDLGIEIVFIR